MDIMDYERMITLHALKVSQKIKDPDIFEDLRSEGYLLFYKALKRFNKKRASFSTYFYKILSRELLKKCIMKEILSEMDFFPIQGIPEDSFCFFDTVLTELDRDAREILIYVMKFQNIKLKDIKDHFYFGMSWPLRRIHKAIKLLKIWWKNNKELAKKAFWCQNFSEFLLNLE